MTCVAARNLSMTLEESTQTDTELDRKAYHGVRNKLLNPETVDQSNDKLSNPIPPNPEPMKLAVGF